MQFICLSLFILIGLHSSVQGGALDEANAADIALITVGNSGVGKSFIDNLILDFDAFEHAISPTGVTTSSSYMMTKISGWAGSTKNLAIFNIPGLIEGDASNIDKNKKGIEQAFSTTAKQVILYVFGNEGGRIRAEDIATFKALNKAYQFNQYSLVLLLNKKPAKAPSDFEAKTIILLQKALEIPIEQQLNFVFGTDLSDVSNVYTDPRGLAFRTNLLHAIFTAEPANHVKHAEIIILEDQIAEAKEMIKIQEKQLEENKSVIDEKQKELDAQKQEFVQRERKFQEDQAEAARKYQEQHNNPRARVDGNNIILKVFDIFTGGAATKMFQIFDDL